MNRETHWREMASHGWEFAHPKSAFFGLGTGMKDQAGVEIFEGDILQCPGFGELFNRMVVRFGRYGPMGSDGDLLGFYVEFVGDAHEPRFWRKDFIFWADRSRVIGNVYENPELVEGGADDGHMDV